MKDIMELGTRPDNIGLVIDMSKVSYIAKCTEPSISMIVDGVKISLDYTDVESRDYVFDAFKERMHRKEEETPATINEPSQATPSAAHSCHGVDGGE